MYDVSVTAQKAHAARYATSFDNTSSGPAGCAGTRKEPPFFSDRSSRLLAKFSILVPKAQCADYKTAVLSRLSGPVGDAACSAACIKAAQGFIAVELMQQCGLVPYNNAGVIRPRRNDKWTLRAMEQSR
jgi:hypothetical protein